MKLAEVWKHLEDDTRVSGMSGRVQRRMGPAGRRNFFLGLEMPSRHRMLIIRVAAESIEGQPEVPDSRGLAVRMAPRYIGEGDYEVELVLTDTQHSDIFDLLIRDLVEAAEEPQEEKAGLTRFLSRLSEWQQLLRRLAPRGLSQEDQQGLWGELWVLNQVIEPVMGMAEAIQSWRGPLGSDQDFQMGITSLEVKTSTAHVMDRLTIASERQLDVPDDVKLILVALSLDARVGYGETLVEMVATTRSAASGSGCLGLLDDRLTDYGYYAQDGNLYSAIGYGVRSFNGFKVGDGFPRIVASDLQAGVADVRYSVSVNACRPYLMATEGPQDLLRRAK